MNLPCEKLEQLLNDEISKMLNNKDQHNLYKVYDYTINLLSKEKSYREELENEIVDRFLNDNKVYFNSTSQLYIYYNKNDYSIMNIEDITIHIFNYIKECRENVTTDSKYKIKNKIIKKAKEQDIKNNIPDSETIQLILNFLCPNIFKSKIEAKYFLILLGDVINGKNDKIIFINQPLRDFIGELNKVQNMYFHVKNMTTHFKLKYHDGSHDRDKCRILDTNDFNFKYFNTSEQFFINFICISLHYSLRYSDSDDFLYETKSNITNKILYLKNNTNDELLDNFINKCITEKDGEQLLEKDMIMLWKNYLKYDNININVYNKYSDFIVELKNKVKYNDEKDTFMNVTSTNIPEFKNFMKFWKCNFYQDEEEYLLEISEISTLYKEQRKRLSDEFDEEHIIEILKIYYNDIKIVDNKYIDGFGTLLWNKQKEIELFLNKKNIHFIDNNLNLNKIYNDYLSDITERTMKVSKKYFMEYLSEKSLLEERE